MTGTLIGYARVSTSDQDLGVQQDALRAAGCVRLFEEKVSGKSTEGREELARCLAFVREGDTLVITRIDRLARSLLDLQTIVHDLKRRGITLRATEQPIDTSTAAGKAFLDMLGVFAEFETNLRRERQSEGLARARAEGRIRGGSKPKYDAAKTIAAARQLKADHGWGAPKIARHLKMSRKTLYRKTAGAQPPLWGAPPNTNKPPQFDVSFKGDSSSCS